MIISQSVCVFTHILSQYRLQKPRGQQYPTTSCFKIFITLEGYSFSIEYTTIICCAFSEMNLLECVKHSYHLAVPNVNPFECIQTLSILNTCNVIPIEGMKCYRLWRYQIISLLNASNVITFWIFAMFFHVFTLCNYLLLPSMYCIFKFI